MVEVEGLVRAREAVHGGAEVLLRFVKDRFFVTREPPRIECRVMMGVER